MQIIDAKGLQCPKPVLMAMEVIESQKSDFAILVDNSAAVENLTRLAQTKGYKIEVQKESGIFKLQFSKTEGADFKCEAAKENSGVLHGDYAVFVGKKIVGSGDENLGTNLMRMLFYTLSQSKEKMPEFVIFMNEGVKLVVEDEEIVKSLVTLRQKGIEILVCGTCLNFYGYTNPLQVGTVSNMYDILTAMQNVSKVITL